MPFLVAVLPIRPGAMGPKIANSIEQKCVEPALLLRKTKGLIVNPFTEAEAKEPWFVQEGFILDENRTAFFDCCRKPRRSTAFSLDDGPYPECQRCPTRILL